MKQNKLVQIKYLVTFYVTWQQSCVKAGSTLGQSGGRGQVSTWDLIDSEIVALYMLKYLIVNCQNCTDHQLKQSENHRRVDESLLRVYLLGPGPHLPPLSLQPPHSLLSPLSPHFKTTYFCKRSILKHSDQCFLFSTQLITIIRKHKVSA